MTECNQKSFGFHQLGRRDVVAGFDGGDITSDAGGLLLREVAESDGYDLAEAVGREVIDGLRLLAREQSQGGVTGNG